MQQSLIKLEKAGKIDEIEKLKRISPIAWAHINIYGRYEFNKEFLNMEFNELIKLMSLDNIKFEENQVSKFYTFEGLGQNTLFEVLF